MTEKTRLGTLKESLRPKLSMVKNDHHPQLLKILNNGGRVKILGQFTPTNSDGKAYLQVQGLEGGPVVSVCQEHVEEEFPAEATRVTA